MGELQNIFTKTDENTISVDKNGIVIDIKKLKRDKRDNLRFLEVARQIAQWSKDPRTKVGAVLVGNKSQIISQGFNGFPREIEDTADRLNDRTTKNKFVIHAEMNSIYNAIFNGASTEGATIYISGLPCCHECAKGIIQTGISKVVMDSDPESSKSPWDESGKLALEMFKEAGVEYVIV